MAHPTQRARQRSKALDDLRASCARLAERFDLIAPEIPERFTKDPSHLPTLQLEAVIAFMDSIETADELLNAQQLDNSIPVRAKIDALTAEVAALRAERDALIEAAKPTAAKKTPPKKKPNPTQGRAAIRA